MISNIKNKKWYPWLVVVLLSGVAFLNYMDRQMLSTMQGAIQEDITELDAEKFGALMAAFMWIYGLMSPVSGIIADRINRKRLIVGSLFVWSAVTFLMGFVDTYDELYALRAVMGFSEALYIPAALSLIADIHNGKTRSVAIGIHMTGLYLGQVAGGFGSIFSNALNWHTVFLICGLAGMIYAVILILFISDPRNSKDKAVAEKKEHTPFLLIIKNLGKSLSLILSSMAFWGILFVFLSLSMPGWGTKNWLPTLVSENLNVSMDYAGPIAMICIAGASFIGAMTGGKLSDKWVQKNVKGRVYTSCIGLALIIPSLILMGIGNSAFVIVLAILTFGIGYGFFDTNTMPILCQFIPSHQRATAYGIINMAGVLGGALITDLLGRLKESGTLTLGNSFAIFGAVAAVALILQLLILRPKTANME